MNTPCFVQLLRVIWLVALLGRTSMVIGQPIEVGLGSNFGRLFVNFLEGPEIEFAVAFPDQTDFTGANLLETVRDAGIGFSVNSQTFGSLGGFVTQIGFEDDCDSGSGHQVDDWWRYWIRNAGEDDWTLSSVGASGREFRDADADAWVFGREGRPILPGPLSMPHAQHRIIEAHFPHQPTGLTDNPHALLGRPTSHFTDTLGQSWAASMVKSPRGITDGAAAVLHVTTLEQPIVGRPEPLTLQQSVTVAFGRPIVDDPLNPYGIDLLLFGDAQFAPNVPVQPDTDMQRAVVIDAAIAPPPISVSVSPDGTRWYTYSSDDLGQSYFPTQAFAWDDQANTWGDGLAFTRPVNPSLSAEDFEGLTVAEAIQLYDGSAGGKGLDLAESGFGAVRFVKIEAVVDVGQTGVVDALADVSPVLAGDANFDGRVTFADFAALQLHFGDTGVTLQEGDFTGDGRVTFADFSLLQLHFGDSQTTDDPLTAGQLVDALTGRRTVPEPQTLWLYAALAGMTRRLTQRRRGSSNATGSTAETCGVVKAISPIYPTCDNRPLQGPQDTATCQAGRAMSKVNCSANRASHLPLVAWDRRRWWVVAWATVLFTNAVSMGSPFATVLVEAIGFPTTPQSSLHTDDPRAVLGEPTTFFVDNLTRFPHEQTYRASMVASPFNVDIAAHATVVTLDSSRSITVAFDHDVQDDPLNPYGIDLIVFGNAFFEGTSASGFVLPDTDMSQYVLRSGLPVAEAVTVSVSPDGQRWHTFSNGPFADGLFPTQAFAWDHNHQTWGDPLDFTRPVDPTLTGDNLAGLSVVEAIELYDGSAGGTGFDLQDTGFSAIRFVRVTGLGGEVDGFADVAPLWTGTSPVPEPGLIFLSSGLLLISPIGRRTRIRPQRPGPRDAVRRAGFTLIELLVVVSVIGVLTALTLPALDRVKETARSVVCQSHLKQMALAAEVYLQDHRETYPRSHYRDFDTPAQVTWEITTSFADGLTKHIPGELWQSQGTVEIQQCPSFDGPDNWSDAPYTGYNYNTSYIGHGEGEAIEQPARSVQVRRPDRCVLFGDGEYGSGGNKFMRAPWPNPGDATFIGRFAGTQGFRHSGRTNAAFCDGHVETLAQRYTDTAPDDQARIAAGTGFLSEDNGLYDLK